ncbi:hypothetical protein RPYSC3_25640 [Rhodopseudomonas palustris]|nr:hypothetical protein RPYSC3_25640 [Rhodopseudomonas palustris]
MQVEEQWGEADEPKGITFSNNHGFSITIAEPHDADDHSWKQGVNGDRPTLYFKVNDVDAAYADFSDKSAVVIEPQNTHWGMRWFVVRDPNDNLIAFFKPT